MKLDERLEKLGAGVSVNEAIHAYLDSLADIDLEDSSERLKPEAVEAEATLELMFLMAAVDGEIAEEELTELEGSIAAVAELHGGEPEALRELIVRFHQRLDEEGWRARAKDACRRIESPEARHFAFRLAVAVAFADQHIANAEGAAFDSLALGLHLSEAEAQEILEEVRLSLHEEEGPAS